VKGRALNIERFINECLTKRDQVMPYLEPMISAIRLALIIGSSIPHKCEAKSQKNNN